MVGYNDAYNRALTAKSNALQRRKGQMIDHLNGSGRGDDYDEDEDDYLSEGDMEGGAAAYEDDYEDEMVGGSFAEASREVGGAMSYGGRATGGNPMLVAALAPSLINAAVPLVSGLFGKLFGGSYTGGARRVKADMLADLKSSADPRLSSALPRLRDMTYKAGMAAMKKGATGGFYGGAKTGGRATGGFLPLLALAAPMLMGPLGKMFGMGRRHPYFKGSGFFDSLVSGLSSVGQALAPVAQGLLPVAQDLATQAATGYIQKKFGGRRCCSSCKGSGMSYGFSGGKQTPYDLAYGGAKTGGRYTGGNPDLISALLPALTGVLGSLFGGGKGGAQRAQTAFDREDERIAMEVKGLKDAERRTKEKNHALGAGGKRLYMKGGQAQVAAMGQESLYGYDNDEQGEGLLPPRNVATKGYMSGCGAMPMYSCGGRALTPVDQLHSNIGGRRGGASAWISHVKAYAAKHGVSYKDALKAARATYRS